MRLVTLDFETYFDKEYTLKKLTTEAYVRDPRFEALCVGLKIDDGPAGSIVNFGPRDCERAASNAVICHHAQFDGLILSHHYGVKPAFWFDTLSMARLVFPHEKSHSLGSLAAKLNLGHKTVPYEEFKGLHARDIFGYGTTEVGRKLLLGCEQDVELTYHIFKKLLPMVSKEELRLIDITVRMFTEPVLTLDVARVKDYIKTLVERQNELLESLGVDKKELASDNKFARLLESLGVDPPVKKSLRTGKNTYAFAKTDPGFLSLVDHKDEKISLLAEARLSTKSTIGETRAGRLLDMSSRGDLCIYLKYYGAHTGRWSGGDKLNFQNFPRGSELRKSLRAPDGYVLCVADLAQIEVRVLAWLAGEKDVLEAFRSGRDLYCEIASNFYNRGITKADKQERFLGKTLVLGCGYGVGHKKLQSVLKLNNISLDDNQARRAVNLYRSKHQNITALWKHADKILGIMYSYKNQVNSSDVFWGPMRVNGSHIILPNGAVMDYSALSLTDEGLVLDNPKGRVKIYGGKLVENVVQALARIIMSEAMLKISTSCKVVTCTHDEVVYLAPQEEADFCMATGLKIIKTPPLWGKDIPLDAEGGWAKEYSK